MANIHSFSTIIYQPQILKQTTKRLYYNPSLKENKSSDQFSDGAKYHENNKSIVSLLCEPPDNTDQEGGHSQSKPLQQEDSKQPHNHRTSDPISVDKLDGMTNR